MGRRRFIEIPTWLYLLICLGLLIAGSACCTMGFAAAVIQIP